MTLLRERPKKLKSANAGSTAEYVSSASSALLANDLSTAAITAAGWYVDLFVKWLRLIACSP